MNEYFTKPSSSLFTTDAVVHDERRQHRGRTEIQAWLDDTARRYQLRSEVLSTDGSNVRARVSGTFPGSPIELNYAFTMRGELIAKLVIS